LNNRRSWTSKREHPIEERVVDKMVERTELEETDGEDDTKTSL
jgi:hypothetical protein